MGLVSVESDMHLMTSADRMILLFYPGEET